MFSLCRYSPFLLACYDPEREEYQSVCRVMSGFTDAFYKEVGFDNKLLAIYSATAQIKDDHFFCSYVNERMFTLLPAYHVSNHLPSDS
jgi:hypothetical protein